MKITFRELTMGRQTKMDCIACGKHLSRMVRVHQTVNPFNKLADGTIKTERDIRNELAGDLLAEIERAKSRAICRNCEVGA